VANAVRVVNVRPKPATMARRIERMARRIEIKLMAARHRHPRPAQAARLLRRRDRQVYAPDWRCCRLRLALVRNPTFETVEMGA
jgi:hypothetical protein